MGTWGRRGTIGGGCGRVTEHEPEEEGESEPGGQGRGPPVIHGGTVKDGRRQGNDRMGRKWERGIWRTREPRIPTKGMRRVSGEGSIGRCEGVEEGWSELKGRPSGTGTPGF
jgi:hypothetical protein